MLDIQKLSWFSRKRLEYIDYKIETEGFINRVDLMQYFDISTPQASKDLSIYQTIAPENLIYDKSQKCYLKSDKFKPCFSGLTIFKLMDQRQELLIALASAKNGLAVGKQAAFREPGQQRVDYMKEKVIEAFNVLDKYRECFHGYEEANPPLPGGGE